MDLDELQFGKPVSQPEPQQLKEMTLLREHKSGNVVFRREYEYQGNRYYHNLLNNTWYLQNS